MVQHQVATRYLVRCAQTAGGDGDVRRVVRQREEQLPLRPPGSEEVSATILVKTKKPAETYLGRKVSDVLVAVPA